MDTQTKVTHGATTTSEVPSVATQTTMDILSTNGGASQGLVETESLTSVVVAGWVGPNILFMLDFHIQQLNLQLQQEGPHMVFIDSAVLTGL